MRQPPPPRAKEPLGGRSDLQDQGRSAAHGAFPAHKRSLPRSLAQSRIGETCLLKLGCRRRNGIALRKSTGGLTAPSKKSPGSSPGLFFFWLFSTEWEAGASHASTADGCGECSVSVGYESPRSLAVNPPLHGGCNKVCVNGHSGVNQFTLRSLHDH